MNKNILVMLAFGVMSFFLTSCPGASTDPISGNIEVKLLSVPLNYNMQAMSGKPVYAKVYTENADILMVSPVSTNGWFIIDGKAHFIVQKTEDSYFDAGKTYDLYIFVDMDVSSSTSESNPTANTGDVSLTTPKKVKIDGTQVITVQFTELTDVP